MKHLLKYFLLILPIATFFSCSTEPESHVEYYLLKVDSIQHADKVRLNSTITITVSGLAGYDGCHSFSHFDGIATPTSIDLKVWGKVVPDQVCLQVLVPYKEEFSVTVKERGIYRIKIYQPDGSALKDSLLVL